MATGRGTVRLQVKLLSLQKKILNLYDTLMAPGLTYNLLSVPKTAENGKTTVFNETHCEIQEDNGNVVAYIALKCAKKGHSQCRVVIQQ